MERARSWRSVWLKTFLFLFLFSFFCFWRPTKIFLPGSLREESFPQHWTWWCTAKDLHALQEAKVKAPGPKLVILYVYCLPTVTTDLYLAFWATVLFRSFCWNLTWREVGKPYRHFPLSKSSLCQDCSLTLKPITLLKPSVSGSLEWAQHLQICE